MIIPAGYPELNVTDYSTHRLQRLLADNWPNLTKEEKRIRQWQMKDVEEGCVRRQQLRQGAEDKR